MMRRLSNRNQNLLKHTIRACLFCLAPVLVGASVQAASIFTNSITDPNPSAANPFTTGQTVDPNATASGIGRGTGITANAGSDRYNSAAWNSPSLDAADYFTWTITPTSGNELDFSSFLYTAQKSGTGPSSFAFRSSLDGFSASIGTPTATGTTIDLSAAAYQHVATPVEFRLYGWGATSAAGTFSVNDFTFSGTVSAAVPEPALAGLLIPVLGLALAGTRRFV